MGRQVIERYADKIVPGNMIVTRNGDARVTEVGPVLGQQGWVRISFRMLDEPALSNSLYRRGLNPVRLILERQ
jgi:hypothetical protein